MIKKAKNGSSEEREYFNKSPTKSQRRVSCELDIARTTLRRVMKELQLRSRKPHLELTSNDLDPDRRDEFRNWYLNECDLSDDFQDQIL